MPRAFPSAICVLGCILLSTSGLLAQVTIGSLDNANTGYGYYAQTLIGEVFTVPLDNVTLETYQTNIALYGTTVNAYLVDWNANTGTPGTTVWSSLGAGDSSVFANQLLTFNVGTVLTGGDTYAFLTNLNPGGDGTFQVTGNAGQLIGSDDNGPPQPGSAYYTLNGQASFLATFDNAGVTAVPESPLLICGGLVLCAGLFVRFGRKTAAETAG